MISNQYYSSCKCFPLVSNGEVKEVMQLLKNTTFVVLLCHFLFNVTAFNVIYDIVCFCFIDLVTLHHDSGQPYACVVPADVFVCVLWGSHSIMWPAGDFPWYAHSLLYGSWSKFECVCMWTCLYVFILSLYACENKYCILLFLSVQILLKNHCFYSALW